MKNKAYIIKPLIWSGEDPVFDSNNQYSTKGYYAKVPMGSYSINANSRGRFDVSYCFDEYYDEGEFEAETIEEAKNKAQEDFIQRILPSLEEVELPGQETKSKKQLKIESDMDQIIEEYWEEKDLILKWISKKEKHIPNMKKEDLILYGCVNAFLGILYYMKSKNEIE